MKPSCRHVRWIGCNLLRVKRLDEISGQSRAHSERRQRKARPTIFSRDHVPSAPISWSSSDDDRLTKDSDAVQQTGRTGMSNGEENDWRSPACEQRVPATRRYHCLSGWGRDRCQAATAAVFVHCSVATIRDVDPVFINHSRIGRTVQSKPVTTGNAPSRLALP